MSCLYSSPEVIGFEVASLEVVGLEVSSREITNRESTKLGLPSSSLRPERRLTRTESRHHSIPRRFTVHRDQQRRVPRQSSAFRRLLKSIRLPKQAQLSCVSFQAQYQAFVRFAVGSSAALSAIALNWTCVLEPFTRGGLSL